MRESYTTTLPYPPSANAVWRNVNGRTLLSRQARAYRERVALAAAARRVKPFTGPVSVTLIAYRPRSCGDLDNTFKAGLDALKGVAYVDDSQVVEIHAYRADDKDNPRLVVCVSECEERPTFLTQLCASLDARGVAYA